MVGFFLNCSFTKRPSLVAFANCSVSFANFTVCFARLVGSQIARSLLHCSISLSFANCSVSFVLLGFGLFCMVLSLVHRDRAQESEQCQRDKLLRLFCNCLVSFVVSCTLSSNCTARSHVQKGPPAKVGLLFIRDLQK